MSNIAFRATKILSTVEGNIPVDVSFRATAILPTLRADIPVASELSNTWKILCFPSTNGVENAAFQSY